jgi:hypothetical protein
VGDLWLSASKERMTFNGKLQKHQRGSINSISCAFSCAFDESKFSFLDF